MTFPIDLVLVMREELRQLLEQSIRQYSFETETLLRWVGSCVRESRTISKVPLLGDIPVLGWLFKNVQKSRDKVNLLFFLTPKILTPYAKLSSETTKDLINRRVLHLQNEGEQGTSFLSTLKGLFERVNSQSETGF